MEPIKDSLKSKLKYFFSTSFPKYFKFWKRDKYEQKNHIRLAVVGTRSSGKSFLLKDLIGAVGGLGGTPNNLEIDGFSYKGFGEYSPNEKGGEEGTPVYACRRENIYGAEVGFHGTHFSMEFVNIPGEIFDRDAIADYIKLRNLLIGNRRRLFKTLTYNNGIDTRLIVIPNCDIDDSSPTMGRLEMSFSNWNTIFDELEKQDYKYVEGSQMKISGKELMKHFFKYDTDSVMQSILTLLKNGKLISDTSINIDDYENNKRDLQFVFFHYCSLATDLVLCDRVFVPKIEENQNVELQEMPSSILAQQIDFFFYNIDPNRRKRLFFYLAFRNVDFLLRKKQNNYQGLLDILKKIDSDKTRNIIYSLFHYLMMHHVYDYILKQDAFDYRIIGKEDNQINYSILHKDNDATENAKKLINEYLDLTPTDAMVFQSPSLALHITSCVGNQGGAFRLLLQRTGWIDNITNMTTQLVPHVYFTCTPVTQDLRVFRNGVEGKLVEVLIDGRKKTIKVIRNGKEEDLKESSTEFYHNEDPSQRPLEFTSCGSPAWFGSSQLLMDILIQHDIYTGFKDTPLLRDLFDGKEED